MVSFSCPQNERNCMLHLQLESNFHILTHQSAVTGRGEGEFDWPDSHLLGQVDMYELVRHDSADMNPVSCLAGSETYIHTCLLLVDISELLTNHEEIADIQM